MMKKITKLALTLALLVASVGSMNAEKLSADLTKYDSWDGNNISFSWTATWGNQLGPNLTDAQIGLPKGDLRNWEKLVVVVDELKNCDFFRVLVYNGEDSNHSNTFKVNKTGSNEFTLSGNVDFLNNVTRICLSGSNGDDSQKDTWGTEAASFKVKEVYLERPDIVYIEASEIFEAPTGTTDLKNLTGTESNWANTVVYPKELAVQGASFGNGDGSNESTHVDITGFDYLCFYIPQAASESAALRTWIWDGSKVVTLYAHPIADYATADYTVGHRISTGGTYVVKVSGYNDLKGVKADNNWGAPSVTVNMAYMTTGQPVAYQSTGKYQLVGEAVGSGTLSDALADESITYYDATGVYGTGVNLIPANPNALFKANAGALANTENVIVDGTCANLVLTDQKPFKAPEAFTATNATLEKTVSSADYATLVLPFAAALPAGVEAYDIESVTGDVLNTKAVDAIAANKPVLLKNAGTYSFTATNAEIAATPAEPQQNGLLYGVYATTDVPTSNGYVLQNQGGEVSFFKSVEGMKANAFRAYLATTASARLTLDLNSEATGIAAAKLQKEAAEVYNLNGQRVAQPQKGLYIVDGKKVMVK